MEQVLQDYFNGLCCPKFLLQEDGFNLLQEYNSKIII